MSNTESSMVPMGGPLSAPVRLEAIDPTYMGKAFAAMVQGMIGDGTFDMDILKGHQAKIVNTRPPKDGPMSAFLDPWEIMGYTGARHKNTPLTMAMLREMARACKPVAGIIATRQNQAARFCRPPRYRGDIGFAVRMRDKDEKAGPAAKKRIRDLENFIHAMGAAPAYDAGGRGKRPGFEQWVRMTVRDSLTLDAVATEPRLDRAGNLFDLWPVDAATIRFAQKGYDPRLRTDLRGEPVVYLQEYQGETMMEYAGTELIYEIRNPRTDIVSNGYGFSEMEVLIETITAILNADNYNSRYFTQNSLPEGVLSLQGNISQPNLEAFRRAWTAQVSGVYNAWKVPILSFPDGKGVQFTPFKQSNKDMQFNEYNDFLITVTCAVYQIDREEIGFPGNTKGTSAGLGGGGNEATLQHSQSKGLYPLMTFLERVVNEHIIYRLDEEFCFAWEGLDPDREATQWTQVKDKILAGVMTPRMYWKEFDIEDPYPDMMWPDAPANTTLANVYMQESGVMGDEGDDQGQPGAPGGQGDGQGGPPQPGAPKPPKALAPPAAAA